MGRGIFLALIPLALAGCRANTSVDARASVREINVSTSPPVAKAEEKVAKAEEKSSVTVGEASLDVGRVTLSGSYSPTTEKRIADALTTTRTVSVTTSGGPSAVLVADPSVWWLAVLGICVVAAVAGAKADVLLAASTPVRLALAVGVGVVLTLSAFATTYWWFSR